MRKSSRPLSQASFSASLGLLAALLGASASAQNQEVAGTGTVSATPWAPPVGPIPEGPPPRATHEKVPPPPVGNGTMVGTACPPTTPALGAASPSAPTVYRNTLVKPSGASTSNVGEPTSSHLGGTGALMTGNWWAACSSNDGATWSYINPYTKFPSIDGGFCCDQYGLSVPKHGIVVWSLLYLYSTTTQKNTIRLGVLKGGGNVGTGTVAHWYDINSQTLGYPAGTWIDYNSLAKSDKWLYMTGNVFNGGGSYQGPIVMRIDLAAMAAGSTASIGYYRPAGGSPRCSAGDGTRMFIATHNSTTSIRVSTWDDASGSISHFDRTIPAWYSGMTAQPGPDGNNFLSRCDNRITAGAHSNNGQVGFYWTSNLGGSYPRPFIRGVIFDGNLNYLRDENIWTAGNAWGYPAASVNAVGHVGYCCAYGGGTFHAGCNVFIKDNVDCFPSNAAASSGNAGPAGGFGDYLQVQQHPTSPMTFIATAMAQVGGTGNGSSEPRDVHFGRTTTVPTLFNLNVESLTPAGAAITVTVKDNYCDQNGTTNFTRTYAAGTGVTLTAPTTLGSRSFYRWRLDSADQAVGITSLAVTMNSAHLAQAVYGVYTTPTVASFGTACPGTAGVPALSVLSSPIIGQSYTHRAINLPNGKTAYLSIGTSKTSWPPLTLPYTLPPTSCTFYCNAAVLLGQITPASRIVDWTLAVPNNIALLGGRLYTQNLNLDLGANSWNLTMSNALDEVFGGWNLN